MTFGLRNAAQIFQRFMDEVLRSLEFVYVYLDDIVLALSEDQHEKHLYKLFSRLTEFGVVVNLAKCVFGKHEVQFLYYTLSTRGVKPLPKRVRAICDFPKPQTLTQFCRFLGMLNFYRRFIPHASTLQPSLNKCLSGPKKSKNTPITWSKPRKCILQLQRSVSTGHNASTSEPPTACDLQSDWAAEASLQPL